MVGATSRGGETGIGTASSPGPCAADSKSCKASRPKSVGGSGAGNVTPAPQLGHFVLRPANLSWVLRCFPHSQVTLIIPPPLLSFRGRSMRPAHGPIVEG